MTFQCWIVDDEKAAHKGLALALRSFDDFKISKNYYAIDQLPDNAPDNLDIVFLDIEMPRADGFVLFERWQERIPLIVFITAYSQHSLRAFENHAFDYLLKPIDICRFNCLIERLRRRLREQDFFEHYEDLSKLIKEIDTPALLLPIPTDEGLYQISIDNILYIQAVGDFVAVKTNDKELITRSTLKAFTIKLNEKGFVQIHRSFLVNTLAIKNVENTNFGDAKLYLNNGDKLKVSRRYKKALIDVLNKN